MTLLDPAPPSSAAPATAASPQGAAAGLADNSSRPVTDARRLLRRARLPLLLVALLALGGLLLALVSSPTSREDLDPEGATQGGSRALARLLGDRGAPVARVPRLDAVAGAGAAATTVAVPSSVRVGTGDLHRLADLASDTDVVVVVDDSGDLQRLGAGKDATLDMGFDDEHEPRCDLATAAAAGRARTGGPTLRVSRIGDLRVTARCYPGGKDPSLVQLRAPGRPGSFTMLTSADLLRNDRLAEQGNAALALGLLDRARPVSWLLPLPGEPVADTGQATPVSRLLPRRLLLAAGELVVVALLLALWRGRRLGPVVTEPLPVVVRSVETVQGRARLYRGAGARDRAGLALREAARARAARALGLGPQTTPRVLVDAVSARAGRRPEEVTALLYGAPAAGPPADDAALVGLADALDTLVLDTGRGGSRRTPLSTARPGAAP